MEDEEIVQLFKAMELRMEQRFDAQMKAMKLYFRELVDAQLEKLDAKFKSYLTSTETPSVLTSQVSSTSPKVEDNIDGSLEPVINTKSLKKPLDLVCGNISNVSDPGRSQSIPVRSTTKKAARRTPKAKEIGVASSDVVDSRSTPTRAARRTPTSEKTEMALDLRAQDRRRIFDRGRRWILDRERRWIFDRRRLWIFDDDGRDEVVTGGRSEAWSRRIAELHWRGGVEDDPLLGIHWFAEETYICRFPYWLFSANIIYILWGSNNEYAEDEASNQGGHELTTSN